MIDIIVSKDCLHCESQLDVMQKSFFEDEYRIINENSKEYSEYESEVTGFPFIIVKDEKEKIMYSSVGVHSGTKLRKIQRQGTDSKGPFNLKLSREISG